MQSKIHTHLEIWANQVVGIVINWSIMYWVLPFVDIHTTPTQASAATAIYFAASYARMYVIRRVSNYFASRRNG